MNTIISADFVRRYRQVAKNILDERVEICISEAEQLDITPAVGATLLRKYRSIGKIIVDAMGSVLQDESGNDIWTGTESLTLTPQEYKFLNGGYYKTDCGGLQWFAGVKVALAYYSYARFVRANAAQVTPYGVVVKEGDDSRAASREQVAELADDARKIADEHLRQAMEYWNGVKGGCSCNGHTRQGRRHFIAIGD